MNLTSQLELFNVTNNINQVHWNELQNNTLSLYTNSTSFTYAAATMYIVEKVTSIVSDFFSNRNNEIQENLTKVFCDVKYCHPLTSFLSKMCYLNKIEFLFPKLIPLQGKPSDLVVYSNGLSRSIPGWGWIQQINKLISSEKSLKGVVNFNPTKVSLIFKNYIQSMIKHGFNINEDLLWQGIKPLRKVAQEGCEILTQTFIDLGAKTSTVDKNEIDDTTMMTFNFLKGEGPLDQKASSTMDELVIPTKTHANTFSKPSSKEILSELDSVFQSKLHPMNPLLKRDVKEQQDEILNLVKKARDNISKLKVGNALDTNLITKISQLESSIKQFVNVYKELKLNDKLLQNILKEQSQELELNLPATVIA